LPSKLAAQRFGKMNFVFRALAGTFSLGLGVFTVYDIGFVNHLLR